LLDLNPTAAASLLIRQVMQNRIRAIDLFEQDDSGKLVGQGHSRKRQNKIRALPDILREPVVTAHDKSYLPRAGQSVPLDEPGQLKRIQLPTALIQGDDARIPTDTIQDVAAFFLNDPDAIAARVRAILKLAYFNSCKLSDPFQILLNQASYFPLLCFSNPQKPQLH
jgi:hypothetical protein